MKNLLCLIALALISVSCKYGSLENYIPPGEYGLRVGQMVNISADVRLTLDSIVNDSRCPIDGICIWEGNAQVRFVFYNSQKSAKFVLNTTHPLRTDTLMGGYRIKLLSLSPYPSSNEPTRQSDYKAAVQIKRVSQ